MSLFLGIDTSNYTTSVAVYNSEKRRNAAAKTAFARKTGTAWLKTERCGFSSHTTASHSY